MRPLGYWLKHIDALIEADFAAALADFGLDRRTWQVLNTLHAKPHTYAELTAAVAPFPDTDAAVRALAERGLITVTENTLYLNDTGEKSYVEVAARVRERRERITRGISDEEYAATITVFERMAANLTTSGS
ncbi:hypothetical protein [Allokutzneria oryzae]|uniref:MarR family transcriptional regulator n=1 Tax=Allokutzneria oryzae TaxID=1378989 RepID=A0ABV6A4B8_9PSEU